MIDIFEKLIEADFKDQFEPPSEEEAEKRLSDWFESMDDDKINDVLEDYLYSLDVEDLTNLYNEKTRKTPEDLIIEDLLSSLQQRDIISWTRELIEEGEIEP